MENLQVKNIEVDEDDIEEQKEDTSGIIPIIEDDHDYFRASDIEEITSKADRIRRARHAVEDMKYEKRMNAGDIYD